LEQKSKIPFLFKNSKYSYKKPLSLKYPPKLSTPTIFLNQQKCRAKPSPGQKKHREQVKFPRIMIQEIFVIFNELI
jgi:hypothetical protein